VLNQSACNMRWLIAVLNALVWVDVQRRAKACVHVDASMGADRSPPVKTCLITLPTMPSRISCTSQHVPKFPEPSLRIVVYLSRVKQK
jgi:hypothetical protein